MDKITFEPFPKIPRLYRECTVTEKLDGTNAQVIISDSGEVRAASRRRLLTPEDDNFGFARWVHEHEEELLTLGVGRHYGEWWGQGIQRTYGLKEKRFSLFNVARWDKSVYLPACCHVVPVLYQGEFNTIEFDNLLEDLHQEGSVAAPGFMNPEGIIVWHDAARQMFKATLDNNDKAKGE